MVGNKEITSECSLHVGCSESESRKERKSHRWKGNRQLSEVCLARSTALLALLTCNNAPLLSTTERKKRRKKNSQCSLNPHTRTVALFQFASQRPPALTLRVIKEPVSYAFTIAFVSWQCDAVTNPLLIPALLPALTDTAEGVVLIRFNSSSGTTNQQKCFGKIFCV